MGELHNFFLSAKNLGRSDDAKRRRKRGSPNSKTGHGKKENVCEMSKSEKCTCKACKTIVFLCQICKFVTSCCPRRRGCLSSLFAGENEPKKSFFVSPLGKALKECIKYLNCQRFCSLLYFKQYSQRGKCTSPLDVMKSFSKHVELSNNKRIFPVF